MKKVLSLTIVLLTIITMSKYVSAATTGAITLNASTGTIKANDEFTVIVKASDSNNLNSVEYKDIKVTDANGNESSAITIKSVESIGSWAKMSHDGMTAFMYSGDSLTKESDICKITFKVSETIPAGTYNININELYVYSVSLTDDQTSIGSKSISVVVQGEEKDEGNTNVDKPNKEENKQDNSTSGGSKLPQTGVENISIIAMLILSIISVVSLISYKKYSDIK